MILKKSKDPRKQVGAGMMVLKLKDGSQNIYDVKILHNSQADGVKYCSRLRVFSVKII